MQDLDSLTTQSKASATIELKPLLQDIKVDHILLGDVLHTADSLNKLVLIQFYADWCLPCKQMEKNVMMREDVKEQINQFVFWKIDIDHPYGKRIKDMQEVTLIPAYVILTSKGVRINRLDEAVDAEKFLQFLKQPAESNLSPIEENKN